MSETSFRFKQFTIHQEKCAMKVGTDAVLLGSWVLPENANHILDIGSGTGIIALMLAQKSEAEIDAIDIDENAYNQTKENFRISPWFFRMYPHHISLQEFAKDKVPSYDLIVTNPPYFHHASKPNVEARIHARHSEEGMEFLDKAQKRGLFCRNLLRVRTRSDKSEKRLLMQFSFQFGTMTDEEITIQEEDGSFTNDYIELTKEYYINLKNSLTK